MMRVLLTLALWLLPLLPLQAEEVVLGLSENSINITTDFNGSSILIFGAVHREAPKPAEPMQVLITVSGPDQPLIVRRKDRKFGIWMNTVSLPVDSAPSFYAIATSAPWAHTLSEVADSYERISIDRVIRSYAARIGLMEADDFLESLIRIRKNNGQYSLNEGGIEFTRETLFRTTVSLPSDLIEGDYDVSIYLTREGAVVGKYSTTIDVRKVGLERWLYNLAFTHEFLYALLSLVLAVLAGWGASEVFRRIRG